MGASSRSVIQEVGLPRENPTFRKYRTKRLYHDIGQNGYRASKTRRTTLNFQFCDSFGLDENSNLIFAITSFLLSQSYLETSVSFLAASGAFAIDGVLDTPVISGLADHPDVEDVPALLGFLLLLEALPSLSPDVAAPCNAAAGTLLVPLLESLPIVCSLMLRASILFSRVLCCFSCCWRPC